MTLWGTLLPAVCWILTLVIYTVHCDQMTAVHAGRHAEQFDCTG